MDDRRLAERYSLSRLEHQGQGRRRIQADLARRGLAPDTVRAGLDAALGEVSETEALTAVARRYWVQQAKVEPPRRLRRLRVFLLRRGFPPDLVHNRLRAIWPRLSAAIEDVLPDNSWGEE